MTLNLTIKVSTGKKFNVSADEELTVAQFKEILVDDSGIPAPQQRLIYAGRVLKDGNTLASCGIKDEHTVHLVRGAAPPGSQGSQSAPPASQTTPQAPSQAPAPSTTPMAGGNPLLGGGLGGIGMGGAPSMQQARQMMQQNPEMMREMMRQPWVADLLNNPAVMENFINNNPEMQAIMRTNPEIAQAMRDPEILRQTTEMMANPEMMQEFQRNMDNAMGHIETLPGGFNHLASMFHGVQQPMEEAARAAGQPEFGHEGAATAEPTTQRPTEQTTTPMPNPWAPQVGGGLPDATQAAPPTLPSPFAGMNMPGMTGMPMPSPDEISTLMQNPMMQQTMQQMLGNPEMMEAMIQSNPMLQQAVAANPQLRETMTNPDALRQMSQMMANPDAMRNMLQMQQSMQALQGMGLFGMPGTGAAPGSETQPASTEAPPLNNPPQMDFSSMMRMMGGGAAPGAQPAPTDLRITYRNQLNALNEMGFIDDDANIRALTATGGNIHAAIDRLISGI